MKEDSKVDWNAFIDMAVKMDREDVSMAWNILRKQHEMLNKRAAARLYLGQRVSFPSKNRGIITGIITKFNRKSINVKPEHGPEWRVSPDLLTPVEEEATV